MTTMTNRDLLESIRSTIHILDQERSTVYAKHETIRSDYINIMKHLQSVLRDKDSYLEQVLAAEE